MSETDAILAASTVRANAKTDQISGIPPRPLGVFRIGDVIDGGGHRIKFRFTTLDTKSSGYTICYVGRVKILKKTGANNPSANPNDGTVVLDAIRHRDYGFEQYKDAQYDDTDVIEGQTYTYTAYVYSDHNICNIQEPSIQSIEVKANPDPFSDFMVWGFYQNFADGVSDRQITYDWLGDEYGVINKNYDRAVTNAFNVADYGLTNITLGSWKYFLTSERYMNNHMWSVSLSNSLGISKVKDDEFGYHECEDGTDLTTTPCILMPWINKIYTRTVYDSDNYGRAVYFVFEEDFNLMDSVDKNKFRPIGFYDMSENILKGLFLPGVYYNGSYISNTDSANITTQLNKSTAATLINTAANYGNRCVPFGGPICDVMRDIEYMIFKTSNIQKASTAGNCNGGSPLLKNRVDDDYLVFDDRYFISGFGSARNNGIPEEEGKNAGFMFHSRVLGTYDVTVLDPYLASVSDSGTVSGTYMNDIYRQVSSDPIRVYNIFANQRTYPNIIPKIAMHGREWSGGVSLDAVGPGSTSTYLCDMHEADSATVGYGWGYCSIGGRLGGSTLGKSGGPEYINPNYATWGYAQSDSLNAGTSILLLPNPDYKPE